MLNYTALRQIAEEDAKTVRPSLLPLVKGRLTSDDIDDHMEANINTMDYTWYQMLRDSLKTCFVREFGDKGKVE
jgi:hypothetical protein